MIKSIFFVLIFLLIYNHSVKSQDFKGNSIKMGLGIGMAEGKQEVGMGGLFSFGFQKAILKNFLRINSTIVSGEFVPYAITDTRDQYFNTTSLGIYGFVDILKFKSVSLVAGTGGLINYSRGLLGTGGWPSIGNSYSEYFHHINFGFYLGGGLRFAPSKSRFSYELLPLNIVYGNNEFNMAYLNFGIEYKLK